MRRRQFFALAGFGAAIACPLAALAQQPRRTAKVGILNYFEVRYSRVTEFTEALRELGYIEGQNLITIHRWADGQLDRLPELAANWPLANKIDVMIALGPATWAASRYEHYSHCDNIQRRSSWEASVPSLARPGGNVTRLFYMSTDLAANVSNFCVKYMQVIRNLPRCTILVSPNRLKWRRQTVLHASLV